MFNNLYVTYNNISNNTVELVDKLEFIEKKLSLNGNSFPPFLVGILNDFLVNEPQRFYNKKVADEVFNNLTSLYNEDNEKFRNSFIEYQSSFFHSLNFYYHVLDLYNELDDIDFESETKTKIYYIPILTQLMEFCLNHFYRGVASIYGEFKNKDYSSQKSLGQLKNTLNSQYPNLVNIDINFRNAVSHGTIEIVEDGIIYAYREKQKIEYKQIKFWEFNNIKNKLFDIASGAFIGWLKFIVENDIINNEYLTRVEEDEKISFDLVKLFLHNENIRVGLLLKDNILDTHLNIHLHIKNINDKNQLMVLLVHIAKIIYALVPKFDMYIIKYTHSFSLGGMLTLKKEKIQKLLREETISWEDSLFMVADIEDTTVDNRLYKFHRFPKINTQNWEISNIKDFSVQNIKRLKATLTVNQTISSKNDIRKLLFLATKKVRILENQRNLKTKIKYGKVEADVVRLKVFYKTNERGNFELLADNKRFICLVHYYKSKSVPRIDIAFQNHYNFENIKKLDIYWNKNFIDNGGDE